MPSCGQKLLAVVATAGVMIAAAALPWRVSAQDYPNRPIRLIQPIAPGTSAETHIRLLSAEVAKQLGQPIIIENRVGGGGKVGLNAVLSASKDGYVIGMGYLAPLVVIASADPQFKIEPGRDYLPITLTTQTPYVMVASPAAPFRDLRGFIAYAKANPGKISVSGVSYGSGSHLGWELLKMLAGIDVVVVNYPGEAQSIPPVINGDVQAMIGSGSLKPLVDTGKLVGLATTGGERWSTYGNLPTVNEAGVKGYEIAGWYGLIAPAGVPTSVINKLADAYRSAISQPDMRKKLEDSGLIPVGSTPEEFARRIRADMESISAVIQKSGMKFN